MQVLDKAITLSVVCMMGVLAIHFLSSAAHHMVYAFFQPVFHAFQVVNSL